MIISYSVVGHPDRRAQAEKLATTLAADLVMDRDEGHQSTHRRAWAKAPGFSDWHVVLEDDAVPCPRFEDHVRQEIAATAPDTMVSFYMGTGYPIGAQGYYRLAVCNTVPLTASKVWHAVCLAMPTDWIPSLLAHTEHTRLPWDEAVTAWVEHEAVSCRYTMPSHSDHRDGTPILPASDWQPRRWPRHAHVMCGAKEAQPAAG